MRLQPIHEAKQTFDPFDIGDLHALDEYKGLERAYKSISNALLMQNSVLLKLQADHVVLTMTDLHVKYPNLQQNIMDNFIRVQYFNGLAKSPSSEGTYYIDKAMDPKLVKQAKSMFYRHLALYDELDDLKSRMKKLQGAASDKHLEQIKEKDPTDIKSDLPAIVAYGMNMKREWIHNPIIHMDAPHYAGDPGHYDWKDSAMKKEFFVISRWMEHQHLGEFTRLYAANEDGKPSIVAIGANHAVVWQYHNGVGHIYIANAINNVKIKMLEGIAKPFSTDIRNELGETARYAKNKLTPDGKLIKPPTPA
jgi:hypothetical protein